MEARRPVSTPVRALAAFSYVFPVAMVLLCLPGYRQVRLIRIHGITSLLLAAVSLLLVLVLGSLRPGVLEVAMIVGVALSLALLAYAGIAVWSAVRAYQGRDPPVPGVARLAARLAKGPYGKKRVSSSAHGSRPGAE